MKSRRFAGRLRALLLWVIAALFALSIPWYRRGGEEADLWLGLPDWVTVAILCYVGVAVLNSIAWLITEVGDHDDETGESR